MKETLPISLSLTNFLYLFYLYIIFQPPGREGQQHQSPSQLVGLSKLSRCRQGTSSLIQLSCCHPILFVVLYILATYVLLLSPKVAMLSSASLDSARLQRDQIQSVHRTQHNTASSWRCLTRAAGARLAQTGCASRLPAFCFCWTESPKKMPKRASLGENKLKKGLLRLNLLF